MEIGGEKVCFWRLLAADPAAQQYIILTGISLADTHSTASII